MPKFTSLSLSDALKGFKTLTLLCLAAVLVHSVAIPLAANDGLSSPDSGPVISYILTDGVVMARYRAPAEIVEIRGRVLFLEDGASGAYYLKLAASVEKNPAENGDPGEAEPVKKNSDTYSVGYIPRGSTAPAFETALPPECGSSEVRKFVINDGCAYVLMSAAGGERSSRLFRVSLNSGDVRMRENVQDIYFSVNGPLLLERDGKEIFLNCNGERVPCGLPGAFVISAVVDGRLAFVTDGRISEVVDIEQKRNLYRYGTGVNYAYPESSNLVFQAVDEIIPETEEPPAAEGKLIFYKVYIDGTDSGRTGTGVNTLLREYSLMVEPGMYHVFTAERWELDKKKEQYVRVNNVYQPKPVRLYVPENRIIRLRLFFDGKKYGFRSEVVTE